MKTVVYRIDMKYTKDVISDRIAIFIELLGVKDSLPRRKRAKKVDFQNSFLCFNTHKIFAGIGQRKIVKSEQLLVSDT